MTLEQIKKSNTDMLTCADVATVLGCNAYTLHIQAQDQAADWKCDRNHCSVLIQKSLEY